jgi:hypothetical protein
MGARRSTVLTALAALLALAGGVLPARAGSIELDASTVWEAVADPDLNRVWIATGDEGLLVTDRLGRELGRPVAGRVTSVALGSGGDPWAALPNARQLVHLDPATLAVKKVFTLPRDLCPGDVAKNGTQVLIGYSCFRWNDGDDTSTEGGLAVLDVRTGSIRKLPGDTYLQPLVATSPALPDVGWVVDYTFHATRLIRVDLTTMTVTANVYLQTAVVTDMDVSPDGRWLAVLDQRDPLVRTYSTADLSPGTAYELGYTGQAVRWSADGSTLVATRTTNGTDAGGVFRVGTPTAYSRLTLDPGVDRFMATRALAVRRDGQALVAGSRGRLEPVASLEQLGTRPAAITTTGPARVVVANPVTVTAALRLDGAVPPQGTPVEVVRTTTYAGTIDLGTHVTAADGSVTIVDTPMTTDDVTYVLTYAGDTTHVRATASVLVAVDPKPTELSMTWESASKGKKGSGTLVVRLGPTLDNRHVLVNGSLGTLYDAEMGSELRIPLVLRQSTYFQAWYAGGPNQPAARVTLTVVP